MTNENIISEDRLTAARALRNASKPATYAGGQTETSPLPSAFNASTLIKIVERHHGPNEGIAEIITDVFGQTLKDISKGHTPDTVHESATPEKLRIAAYQRTLANISVMSKIAKMHGAELFGDTLPQDIAAATVAIALDVKAGEAMPWATTIGHEAGNRILAPFVMHMLYKEHIEKIIAGETRQKFQLAADPQDMFVCQLYIQKGLIMGLNGVREADDMETYKTTENYENTAWAASMTVLSKWPKSTMEVLNRTTARNWRSIIRARQQGQRNAL